VRREKRLAVIREVTFRSSNQTIDPWEKLLGAVISVENNRDAILFSHGSDMERSRNGSGNCSAVVVVVQCLTAVELIERVFGCEEGGVHSTTATRRFSLMLTWDPPEEN